MRFEEQFNEVSYRLHAEHFNNQGEEWDRLERSWFETDTVDFWRIHRLYEPVKSFIRLQAGTRWLTVGDGRFGLDSVRLKKIEPGLTVMPTDISPYLLEKGKKMGLIGEYRLENAEKLSFKDNEFDYSFCKDAYHHFPRPYIAVYEMLRVSRKGVMFMEPNDRFPLQAPAALLRGMKDLIKRMLGRPIHHRDTWNYEESGNYVYSMSPREIEKVALGLHLPAVAYKLYSDYYELGVEFVKQQPDSPLFRKVRRNIRKEEWLARLGLRRQGGMIAIIFKEAPAPEAVQSLTDNGFRYIPLPENPYLKQKLT